MTKPQPNFDELISQYIQDYPEKFYESLLLGPMKEVYSARLESNRPNWQHYGNFLLDKFAIHSLSFFHLSQGIVERRSDDSLKMAKGYDLFSVNALFRALIETYVAYNWIFVNPVTLEEKEFRFLLWKLDGLFEKRKFEFTEAIKTEAAETIKKDQEEKLNTLEQLKQNTFFKLLDGRQLERVFDEAKHKAVWKYELKTGNELRPLKIIELIQMVCRTDAMLNLYRYSSLFTHSNYGSVETFRQMRGKPVGDDYAHPLLMQAIFLTALVIEDMCLTDPFSADAFNRQEPYFQRFITQICRRIKSVPIRPVK